MFNAEHVNFSKSGATISTLNSSFDRTDWGSSSPTWDFENFPADLVVVNIGANDGGSKTTIKNRYHDFLDDLRAAHPSSHIMLYNAYGWSFNEPAGFIGEVIAERMDSNTSFATFPWVFEQYHGSETDHAGMAMVLAGHIETVMGWVPVAQDVMSGFGRNGNVANGSFEQSAPFGVGVGVTLMTQVFPGNMCLVMPPKVIGGYVWKITRTCNRRTQRQWGRSGSQSQGTGPIWQ